MKKRGFEEIYCGAPTEMVRELVEYRAAHPYASVRLDGLEWRYQEGGQGKETVVLQPGGMQYGEGVFRYFNFLSGSYRLIVLTYPDGVRRIVQFSEAIRAILDQVGVDKAILWGSSLGGIIGQAFIHRYPDRVSKAVFGDTFPPAPQLARKEIFQARVLALVPMGLLIGVEIRQLDKVISATPEPERSFWRSYIEEHMLYRTTKAWLCNSRYVIADFFQNSRFSPEDLGTWKGKILIVESESDLPTIVESQAGLRRLYPSAKVHVFQGNVGHGPAFTREKEYRDMLLAFLTDD